MKDLIHNSTFALCVALLFALLGCSDKQVDEPQTGTSPISAADLEIASTMKINAPGEVEEGGAPPPSALSSEAKKQQQDVIRARHEEFGAFLGLARGTAPLEKAHRATKRKLEENSSVQQNRREQMAAHAMLRYRLLNNDVNSPLAQEATAFYTDLMLKNNNPHAVMILKALERLDGYWQPARIRKAARTASQAARAELAEQADCRSCNTLKDLRDALPESQIDGDSYAYAAMKAADRLEAISESR